ncbi:hypothetical protein A2380_03045 [candidate division WWE3 bacterium RIFOXYB1_FULL_43_24]|uniref:Single-stranded nucleic acid binding R3H domain protein n=1 Tax=candidate division WWE3 bacterium GW2011_GWF1_42_14 TaxID=1619138 RepID=A0A0G1ATZ8_UNCKA|nr:MAG: Single-stranded nucleic acid binding R3H domain protein [candidate division WWE3 bacterium GW2011_GWA1_42_12]KKS37571.1 MAG: Single-stranded nucleic acid binding R3H domain protein [candidate division WWE3 bacterium GW2011_GWF1_42_14]OGC58733.1 MAG: hypothetical protein A2212_00620 [candidate division WWE3 bacterium RIFOXYA1_FULL_42_9]OGC69072.1 MAG: hypothetical protein A2380_03045 [candidate division WWE3 bacterium RIFOXYB1_FULL_43_24]OGC72248.1 MAG: hypothetical protein A2414_01680 [
MNIVEVIKNTLDNIFGFMKINPNYEINGKDDGIFEVKIQGNNLNFLIGHQGQSLDALQSILHLTVLRQTGEQVTVLIDINGYKDQRAEKIQNMAKSYIDRVRFFQKDVELPPMDPWERRQIHMFVAEYDDVISESSGEGRDRRVTLKPKK